MRYIYLTQWVGTGSWLDMFVVIPICVILPLLPLVFPMFWVLLSCYGNTVVAAALLQKTNSTDYRKVSILCDKKLKLNNSVILYKIILLKQT